MGLPQEIKTHNRSGYIAQQTQDFLARWGVKHSTGIPGNSTGQAVIERTHQVLKGLLDKQKTGDHGLSLQDRVLKAVYVMNHLWLVGTRSDPPALTHYSGLQQDSDLMHHRLKVCFKNPMTGLWKGPADRLMFGRGYACVITDKGPPWISAKLVHLWLEKDTVNPNVTNEPATSDP